MRLAILAFCSAGLICPQSGGSDHTSRPAYSVVYTGRLFGYYRYPDLESTSAKNCPDPAAVPLSPQVELFRSTLSRLRTERQSLVAMGENFAPDLLSRAALNQTPGTPYHGQLVNKDILAIDESQILSDNVACFLRLMGFEAIVPGQQDFYYGPERLRQIARFLAQPAQAPYRPVQMLASNLVIASSVRKPNPALSDTELPSAIRQVLEQKSAPRFEMPGNVLPWLRRVPVTSGPSVFQVYDCPASPDDPRSFRLPTDQENRCVQLATEETPSRAVRLNALTPGSNHALCSVYLDGDAQKTACRIFSVQIPLLQDRPEAPGATPAPYFLPADPEGPAIFGVLDPNLISYVGQLSDVWMNVDPRFDTSAQVIDPIEALRQMLDACEADDHCRGRRKVLLAQMPYYKASQLGSKLKVFDIVLAQPDGEHASGEESVSRTGAPEAPYVLSPGNAFEGGRQPVLGVNLRRADFFVEGAQRRSLVNQVFDPTVPVAARPCRSCALNEAVARATGLPDGGTPVNERYEMLALQSMQQFCKADIALLQHRDVFGGFEKAVEMWPASFRPTAQDLLDEVLWKGDFAFCVPVKGATIRRILDESAAFDRQDHDDLSLVVEKGRGLSTLGIQRSPATGAPVIRGQAIEDNKLYGVAMTDYLAFGNTGYPELSSEAIQPVVRIVSLHDLNRLTGLVCRQLPADVTQGSCQADPIAASDYFAAIRKRPFDTSRGVTAWLEFRRWAKTPLQPQPNVTTFFEKKTNSPERIAERRGLWWFTLQNLSLGYNLNFVGGSDSTVPGNFVGNNSFSQLSTPESSALNLWGRARGGYSFPRFLDFYASAELRYSRLAVRSSIGNGNFGQYQLTLGNNLLRSEVGLTSKPLTERVPVRFLVSEDLLTQAVTPFQQFVAPLACNNAPCGDGVTSITNFDLPKNYLVVTRLGARIQNEQSWFEAGREYGRNISLPFSYSLLDAGSGIPRECDVAQGTSLSDCVSADALFTNQTKIIPHLRTQHVAGWFANFHSTVPLWRSKLRLLVDSYGELFDRLPDDTLYNTRFYEDFTLALGVPLWGNLTFAPQVETFYFQNKVLPQSIATSHHYAFVTTSISLQYGFDWRRGVGILRALRFPNGVSSSSTGTVPRP